MRRSALTVLFLTIVVAILPAQPRTGPRPASGLDDFVRTVHRSTLPNGLTLLVREEKGSGVVAIDTWVKAGYFHEPDEVSGMAHLFEHMFFKGSKGFPGAERIATELAKVGGQSNAGTIYDSTNYYFVVPKEGFDRALEIQADAIAHPLFDPGELKKEAEVVIEESNRKYDNPEALSWERMLATAFTRHRIKRWRIGSNEVLRSITRENLLAFYDTVYRPEAMILAIAGDVSHADVESAVSRTFGRLPRGTPSKAGGAPEPPQTTFRYGSSEGDIKQGYSVFGWHTQGTSGDASLTLDLLAAILGDGRSSRLYRGVIGPDGAARISAHHEQYEDVGMLGIQASYASDNRSEVDRRIVSEIERMKSFGPTPYELQLAKNRIESSLVRGLESALGQALALASYEANYGYGALATRLRSLQEISEAQVQAAARAFLTVENMTLYHYHAKGTPAMSPEEALTMVSVPTRLPAIEPMPIPALPPPIERPTTTRGPVRTETANHIPLYVHERNTAPTVALGIYFHGGRTAEHSRNAGITTLMLEAMRQGTKTRTAAQINQELDFLGADIRAMAENDYFGFELTASSDKLRAAVQVLSDMLVAPTFPGEGVARERALQLGAIARSFDDSTARPLQMAFQQLWASHPYGLPSRGFTESVRTLGSAQLADWWAKTVGAERATIVVSGSVRADDVKAMADAAFASLPAEAALPVVEVQRPSPPSTRMESAEYRDRRQSAIVVVFPATTKADDDAKYFRLLNFASTGLSGTLFAELRGRRSLAYTVRASPMFAKAGGAFVGYLASDAAKEPEARQALVEEMKRLAFDGLTADDLERAKRIAVGSTRIGLQTNVARVRELADNVMLGLPADATDRQLDAMEHVTLDELRRASQKYLDTDRYVTAVSKGR